MNYLAGVGERYVLGVGRENRSSSGYVRRMDGPRAW